MGLKSFFDLEKVGFSKEDLEAPYEDKPTNIIFSRENNSSESKPTNVIFSKEELH